jgi:hypothetical protein
MKVTRLAMLATAVALLAIPAAVSAHPTVYTDVAKLVPSTPPSPITPADLINQTRYVVSNHGNTYVLRESNNETSGGVVDYSLAPGAWRSQPTVTTSDLIAQAGTGAQAHHTCTTPALTAVSAIEGWQEESAAGKPEPFFAYVPFQKASAGLDDHPEVWIPHVKTLTGVDLTTVSNDANAATAQLKAMCEALPGPGVFVQADAMQTAATAFNSATILEATNPLNARIGQLNTLTQRLEGQNAAAQRATGAAQAEVARLKTPLRLEETGSQSPARLAADGPSVKVTGPAGMKVTVRLRVDRATGKAIGWKSLVLGKETATIGQDSSALVEFALSRAAKAALGKARRSMEVYFAARTGDRFAATRTR